MIMSRLRLFGEIKSNKIAAASEANEVAGINGSWTAGIIPGPVAKATDESCLPVAIPPPVHSLGLPGGR